MSSLPFLVNRHRFYPIVTWLESRLAPASFIVNDPGNDPLDPSKPPAQTSSGTITLRSAIEQTVLNGGGDTITFSGPMTIDHPSDLYTTGGNQVTIQGIVLDEQPVVTIRSGQVGVGPGSIVSNVAISGGSGLSVGDGSRVTGVFVTNTTSGADGIGGGNNVTVTKCVISNNVGPLSLGSGCTITNNFIGTTFDGAAAALNTGNSITFGSNSTFTGNVCVQAKSGAGVLVQGTGSTIANNYFGTNAAGTASLGGCQVTLNSGNTFENNVLVAPGSTSFFGLLAIDNNIIRNNLIGTSKDGMTSLGTNSRGVTLNDGNLFQGNVVSGTRLAPGLTTGGNGVEVLGDNNKLFSNFIGTNKAGTAVVSNLGDGIQVSGTSNIIGGSGGTKANVIAGNKGNGILIGGTANFLQGNFIGTNSSGASLGNGLAGVYVSNSRNIIGAPITSDDDSLGNVIAHSGQVDKTLGNGVLIPFGDRNTIRLNHILENKRLGIDLGNNYFDRFGTKSGANNNMWHPTIVRINPDGSVHWMLNAPPGKYVLDLYFDGTNNYTDYAEGATHVATSRITVGASGHHEFNTTGGADRLIFTATDSNGNTSEFSLADGDGDGLCDTWETPTGIDINGDGNAEVTLGNANRSRLDVFVEIDSMVGQEFLPGVRGQITTQFANMGIVIHQEVSTVGIAAADFGANPWVAFHALKNQHFGSGNKASLQYQARLLAYHYCILGVSYGDPNNPNSGYYSSGLGELIGNDFMVTLGSVSKTFVDAVTGKNVNYTGLGTFADQAKFPGFRFSQQVGTFIHELGHNLGLSHRGPLTFDNQLVAPTTVEGGPSYVSVMNYFYQAKGIVDNSGNAAPLPFQQYSLSKPADRANIWYAFQEDSDSAAGGDVTITAIDEPSARPGIDPAQADLIPNGLIPDPVDPGESAPLTFVVGNLGADASDTVFTITIPVGVTISNVATTRGTFTQTANSITVNLGTLPSGESGLITFTASAAQMGSYRLLGTASSATAEALPGDNVARIDLVVGTPSPPPPPPFGPPASVSALPKTFSVGTDAGIQVALNSYNPDGNSRPAPPMPFGTFTGGVRVVEADFSGDGIADFAVGSGPGMATRVVVFDGVTQAILFDISPFEASFTGGVYLAAGELTGDDRMDLVITPDEGGGPVVAVYDGTKLANGADAQVVRFFGIEDPNFRGGARAAVADVTGDGILDLLVAAGFGGGPRLSVWDGTSIVDSAFTKHPFGDFFVFEQTLRNGVFIAGGDLNGDGYSEVIAGGGPGGGPRVFALDGKDLTTSVGVTQTARANFFAGDINNRGGIRLAVKNLDSDTKADLVTGGGPGSGSRVVAYAGAVLTPDGTPGTLLDFDAFSGFTGGVFVG